MFSPENIFVYVQILWLCSVAGISVYGIWYVTGEIGDHKK